MNEKVTAEYILQQKVTSMWRPNGPTGKIKGVFF